MGKYIITILTMSDDGFDFRLPYIQILAHYKIHILKRVLFKTVKPEMKGLVFSPLKAPNGTPFLR